MAMSATDSVQAEAELQYMIPMWRDLMVSY
jgi:hypothetical protein